MCLDVRNFGKRLRRERQKQGISGRALARRAGISEALVSALELETSTDPRMSTIIALAQALGVSIQTLIFGRAA